jgi:DNA-binding response OmpR family regulator
MPESPTILLVDDEDSIQKLLTYPLERDGYRVQARDGEEAPKRFAEEEIDLVVLTSCPEDASGSVRGARCRSSLTARDDEPTRCSGSAGRDDYITKPFLIRESAAGCVPPCAGPQRPTWGRREETIDRGDVRDRPARRTVGAR